MGILDTIIDSKHTDLVHTFEPLLTVGKILDNLKERDRTILKKRYGLQGERVETLETVGKQLELTRERVRQIEKSLLKQLKSHVKELEHFQKNQDLLKSTISDHGGIMAEADLLEHLGVQAIEEANAVRFILHLIEEVELVRGENHVKEAWATLNYNPEMLKAFVDEAKQILESNRVPHHKDAFLDKFKKSALFGKHEQHLTDKVIVNFLNATREIRKNPFGEFGLNHWNEINPRDVGDKAYLVMKHHGKPEHYTAITDLINKHNIDGRKAFKETVHNELIKDSRFILVGRGIYALSEWGFKPGVVSDVIVEVLKKASEPLTRDQIVEEVLKHRMVKKNTILVGLSNKKLFKKVGKNLYTLVEQKA
jgi:hypothetical protein